MKYYKLSTGVCVEMTPSAFFDVRALQLSTMFHISSFLLSQEPEIWPAQRTIQIGGWLHPWMVLVVTPILDLFSDSGITKLGLQKKRVAHHRLLRKPYA